jgi:16S rRNA (cytidine1402-2'-O)-methyltransferase
MSGTLFVVATPIGNLEDITARALRTLREVSLIAAEDTRRTGQLRAKFAITTPTTSLHEHNETAKTASLLARLQAGDSIALVSDAGTPAISDPGRLLVRRAIEAGIAVDSVPGPSAVMAAVAASGFPSDSFTFLGFPPTRSQDRKNWFERARNAGGTLVFFEAPHRVRATLEQLGELIGDSPVAVWREMTKLHQELVYGPISVVLNRLIAARGEFTVVVNIGLSAKLKPSEPPDHRELTIQFGRLTHLEGLTRRQAVTSLARKYGMKTNEVYRALEDGKKLVEQQNTGR